MTASPDITESTLQTTRILDQPYLYQNNVSGALSTAPLATRQLCRILCPIAGSAPPQHLNGDTQLLALNEDGSYSESGWKPAKSLAVIREAIAVWYYYEGSPSSNGSGTTTDTATGTGVQGPISCRQLAELYKHEAVTHATRVYSQACTEWTPLGKLPTLQTALQAFDTAPPPPFWNQAAASGSSIIQVEPALDTTTTTADDDNNNNNVVHTKQVQDELEAFLSSTADMGSKHDDDTAADGDNNEGYETDGGTRYVKDPRTGNWIHEALAPKQAQKKAAPSNVSASSGSSQQQQQQQQPANKRKRKSKFAAKNAKCWVYVTGLPVDTTMAEMASVFGKAGIIDLNPETQRPKIKLYKIKDDGPTKGHCKGDASVCFARPESVDLALTLLDESQFRPSTNMNHGQVMVLLSVQRAKFEQHGNKFDDKRAIISNAKRKVAKLAAIQATDWDEGEFNGRLTGGRKGLRIIVLKHMFDPSTFAGSADEDSRLASMEQDLRLECEEWGVVEKITVFSQNVAGVVIVKFTQPGAASEAVKAFDGRQWKDVGRLEASFWDGVTDFTVRDEVKEEKEAVKRQEEFGNWLENQEELPEELRLKVEGP